MLIGFVCVANLFFSSQNLTQKNISDLIYIDPVYAQQVVGAIAPYTANIQEDVDSVAMTLAINENNDGYLSKTKISTTEASKLEVAYTVQKGDTISQIAKKYNLHVATILDRNGISIDKIEKLSPGQTLIIPNVDSSDSQDWLAQINAKKEQEKKLAQQKAAQAKKTVAASSRSVTYRERSDSGYSGETHNFIVPISSKGISRGVSKGHAGIDYRANVGASVMAADNGKIIEITGGWAGGFGNSILVDHGGGWTTRYAHLSQIDVSVGDNVSQGQTIGHSGNTGWSTGPHLHFETRVNGKAINPF